MDGLEAMRKMLAPMTGKVKVSRFDMIGPRSSITETRRC